MPCRRSLRTATRWPSPATSEPACLPDLWLQNLDPAGNPTGEPRRVTSEERNLDGFDWSPDGRSLILSSNRGGAQALWRLAVQGSPAWERLPFGDGASRRAVARQGGLLAYSNILSDTNLYRLAGSGPPVKLCSSTRFDASPRFSSDGQRFVFASDRSGSREIWACEVTGANAVQLTTLRATQAGSPRWSPDGRSVAFDHFQDGHWHILVVSADGGPSRRLTTEAADHARPAWSADSQWIFFGSNRSGAQEQIWKMPAGGGPAVQVTRNGGWDSIASPDGRYVYYAQRSQPGIWRVPVDGGEETKVLDRGRQGRWAVAAPGLYLADTTADGIPFVERFPLDGGRSTRVAELPKGAVIASSPALTVSPDGRTIVLALVDQTESDILLVENFR